MADNFAAFIVHRQTAPESRDWAAKLMGTSALWQSTDQTSSHAATGAGSRRRVREFRVSSDAFAELGVGQAVVHTTLGPPPALCQVTALTLPAATALIRIGDARARCEMAVHPATQLPPAAKKAKTQTAAARTADATTSAPRPRRVRADVVAAPRERAVAPTDRQDGADDV